MGSNKQEIENDWEEILFDFIDFYPCILPHELFEWLEENYEIPKKKKLEHFKTHLEGFIDDLIIDGILTKVQK
jgi:hypothetical protein